MVKDGDSSVGQTVVEVDWPEAMPHEPANVFRVSRIGDEVQVLIGYMSLADVIDRAKGKKEVKIAPTSARGLSLSARAFQMLRERVNEIYHAMEVAGTYGSDMES